MRRSLRGLWVGLGLLLCACAQDLASYQPLVMDVAGEAGQARLKADEADCLAFAAAHPTPFDFGSVARAGAQGLVSDATAAVVPPYWYPLASGAGRAGAQALAGLGVLDLAQRVIYLKCLDHRGLRSGAYSVVDPNF